MAHKLYYGPLYKLTIKWLDFAESSGVKISLGAELGKFSHSLWAILSIPGPRKSEISEKKSNFSIVSPLSIAHRPCCWRKSKQKLAELT